MARFNSASRPAAAAKIYQLEHAGSALETEDAAVVAQRQAVSLSVWPFLLLLVHLSLPPSLFHSLPPSRPPSLPLFLSHSLLLSLYFSLFLALCLAVAWLEHAAAALETEDAAVVAQRQAVPHPPSLAELDPDEYSS